MRVIVRRSPTAASSHHGNAMSWQRSAKVSQAIDELIENRKRSGASARYCYDFKLRLGRFSKNFGDRIISTINTAEIDDWLTGLNLAPVTRNTFRRDLRTFFHPSSLVGTALTIRSPRLAKRRKWMVRLEFSRSTKLPECWQQQTKRRCRISRWKICPASIARDKIIAISAAAA